MARTIAPNDAEQRGDLRYPTHLKATLSVGRSRMPVMIRDISVLGCCLYGAIDVMKGDEVVLSLNGVNAVATVAWAKERYAGINFHREIDPLKVVRDNSDHPMFSRRRLSNTMMVHL